MSTHISVYPRWGGAPAKNPFKPSRPVSGARMLYFALVALLIMPFYLQAAQCPPASSSDLTSAGLVRIGEMKRAAPTDFSFAVFGDNRGSTDVFRALLRRVNGDPDISFAVSTGDAVGMGTSDRYALYLSQVGENLKKPLVCAIGNHELLGKGRELYFRTLGPFYYSFAFGDAYFIVIDDAGSEGIDLMQERWLEDELCAATAYPLCFVFMHQPLFDPAGTTIRHSLPAVPARKLMDILKKYRVTYIFCSHIHGYFVGQWEGIPYVISGGAGAPLIGTDAAHYFYHYLKVRVKEGRVTIDVVPVKEDNK